MKIDILDIYRMPSLALVNYAWENLYTFNEKELKALKKEMLRRNFHRPWQFLIGLSLNNDEDESADNKKDIVKQLKIFRQIGLMKKLCLMKVSYFLYYLKIKKVIEPSLLQYLPDNGDYISLFLNLKSNTGTNAVILFKEIFDFISTFGDVKYITISMMEKDGFTYEVLSDYAEGLEALGLKEKNRIKKSRIKPLINSPYVRKILCAAAVNYSIKNLNKLHEEIQKKEYDDNEYKEIFEYNKILSDFGLQPYIRLDNVEGFEELKKILHSKGFGFFDGFVFRTNDDLINKISEKRKYFYKLGVLYALQFFDLVFDHAYKNNKLLPSMKKKPSSEQLKILPALKEKIKILKNELSK